MRANRPTIAFAAAASGLAVVGVLLLGAGLLLNDASAPTDTISEGALSWVEPELSQDERDFLFGDPSRTHASFCVDGAGGYYARLADVDRVRRTLDEVLTATEAHSQSLPTPLWVSGITQEVTAYRLAVVVRGCPGPETSLGEPLRFAPQAGYFSSGARLIGPPQDGAGNLADPERAREAGIEWVEQPSSHQLAIYLGNPQAYRETFGSEPFAIGQEEVRCEGDVCRSATAGLYVSADASREELERALAKALGLEPPPMPDWEPDARCEVPGVVIWDLPPDCEEKLGYSTDDVEEGRSLHERLQAAYEEFRHLGCGLSLALSELPRECQSPGAELAKLRIR